RGGLLIVSYPLVTRRGEPNSAIRSFTPVCPSLTPQPLQPERPGLRPPPPCPPAAPPAAPLTTREKRDLQKAQLRPLANRRPELYEEDEYSSEEYERMIDMYQGTMASIEEGEIVKAKVMEIRENMVVLDIGFKSEGTIPLEE